MGQFRKAAAALLAALACGRAAAAPDEEFLRAHEALLERNDLQFELAAYTAPRVPEIGWLVRLFEIIGPVVRVLFWAGLAAVVLFLAYFIVRELLLARFARMRAGAGSDVVLQDYRPSAEHARVLLSEVDRLAAEGRFADAVRHLLHRSIQDIEERRPGGLSRALTSREIGAHPALSERARAPFVTIARVVERGFFGGWPLGAEDFATAREAYARFALPEGEA